MFKLVVLVFVVYVAGQVNGQKGSGRNVTGGFGKPAYDWTYGKDSLNDLLSKLKAGNVYIRLHGNGVIKLDKDYAAVGPNTTLDGQWAQITIQGPKGLHIRQVENVVIQGICFKDNETAINMSNGGNKVWVTRNTFYRSAWGSPLAYSGWNCDGKPYGKCSQLSKELTISENLFGDSNYGPLMFLGVQEATFYRNVFRHIFTRIPRAQNQGTYHVCNNVFEGWHLGFQGDDGAKFIYQNNVFNRVRGVKSLKNGQELTNNFVMNDKERIDVCMKGNEIIGDQKGTELKDGPSGGIKFTCNFAMPKYPTDCPAIQGGAQVFANQIKAGAGAGEWCRL